MKRRFACLVLCLALGSMTLMSGCGNKEEAVSEETSTVSESSTEQTETFVSEEEVSVDDAEEEVEEVEEVEVIEPLENEYISISKCLGIEVERIDLDETTDHDVDITVAYMLKLYARNNDLDEDTVELTDEIAAVISGGEVETADEYREYMYEQIEKTKTDSREDSYELSIWEQLMDNTTVIQYPEERLQHEYDNLVELYESYAAMEGETYDEYMEGIGLTNDDLHEAAEAALKQVLVAELISDTYGLAPTDEEVETATQEYIDEYNLTNKDVLYTYVSEEDMYNMILEDKVKAWLVKYATFTEPSPEEEEEEASAIDEEAIEEVEQEDSAK